MTGECVKQDPLKLTEGYMDFKGCRTYYRILGECRKGKKPLMFLHGGPGSTHNSFEVLDSLAEDGRALIMYDQVGCGKSPAPGRTDLFNRETWAEELITLRRYLKEKEGIPTDEIHLLGQSWGGMLLLEYMCHYDPEGIASITLASTLPDSQLWGREQHRMVKELPPEMQEAIAEADRTGNYNTPGCQAATEEFMLRHCAPEWQADAPECLTRRKPSSAEAYVTGWGPNEFTPLGNLKDFNVTAELHNIKAPTLITSGIMDLSTPLIDKLMYDEIPNSRWELFAESRHMAYAEENEKYLRILKAWLNEND